MGAMGLAKLAGAVLGNAVWALPGHLLLSEFEGSVVLCPGHRCQRREVYENVLISAIIAFFSSSGLFLLNKSCTALAQRGCISHVRQECLICEFWPQIWVRCERMMILFCYAVDSYFSSQNSELLDGRSWEAWWPESWGRCVSSGQLVASAVCGGSSPKQPGARGTRLPAQQPWAGDTRELW